MIWPVAFLATASGLMMVSVRSTAMDVACPFSHDLLGTPLTGLLACGAASFRLELLTRDSPHRAPRLRQGGPFRLELLTRDSPHRAPRLRQGGPFRLELLTRDSPHRAPRLRR